MSKIPPRPQRVAFRPERIQLQQSGTSNDWIIRDIKIGNRSQIDPRWYVRAWRRFAWGLHRVLVRLKLRKPPAVRLIKGDEDHG